jgi:hypothetical protein
MHSAGDPRWFKMGEAYVSLNVYVMHEDLIEGDTVVDDSIDDTTTGSGVDTALNFNDSSNI